MSIRSKKIKFLPLLLSLLISLSIGAIGGLLTRESVGTWYKTINKPSFTPPDGVFAPVWTSLFIMMGVAAYLVWKRRKHVTGYVWAVVVYLLQLFLNLMWSYFFFYQHQIGKALVEICIFLVVLIVNALLFYRIDKVAGWLFVPYIAWVSFASYLTYSIFILN